MRPIRLATPTGKAPLPGLFRRGQGFVRTAGQIKVDPYAPCTREAAALHQVLGVMERPSLYLEARG